MNTSEDPCDMDNACQRILVKLDDQRESDFKSTSDLLAELRILARLRNLSHDILDQDFIRKLVFYSENGYTEAQKCMSNLILNYLHIRDLLVDPYVECVEKRFQAILDKTNLSHQQLIETDPQHEIIYYDFRIIFLLTALCPESRAPARDRLLEIIVKITQKEAEKFGKHNHLLIVESLKTLFNLTVNNCESDASLGLLIKTLFAIVGSEKDVIFEPGNVNTMDLTDLLLVNLIHLLTNMSRTIYLLLSDDDVDKVLNHLDCQLKNDSKHSLRDTVLPVLNICANICRFKDEVRARWFDRIMRSTNNFHKRPEENLDLRGRLVKLMTSVDVHLKDIAAEFMYSLCDSDTEKLITYTGFGNSAAFLSSRGLLSNSGVKNNEKINQEDSSYLELRDKIDPITGSLEVSKGNSMNNLSEEEKEFHAAELVDAITKLSNLGIMKPMGLDSEGKLKDLNPDSGNQ